MYGKVFAFFLSLALGYILCILAKKQDGVLKTVGYTLGISILVLSMAYALMVSYSKHMVCGPMSKMCGPMMKQCRMMK